MAAITDLVRTPIDLVVLTLDFCTLTFGQGACTATGEPCYNTYGSTEGTMCGECTERAGLHVPEDLVHMDLYDPKLQNFVKDGEQGRIVLTTLLPVGERTGNLLINYDTDDVTTVLTRKQCPCGRTHMRIDNPHREAETIYIADVPVNRVDIEKGVFQRENMEYLSGEYEAFVYFDQDEGKAILRVSLESDDPESCNKNLVRENFMEALLREKPALARLHSEGYLEFVYSFPPTGGLELYRLKGRPKRLVDRR